MLYRCDSEACALEERVDSRPPGWTPAWKPYTHDPVHGEPMRAHTYIVVWRCPKHPVRKEAKPATITPSSETNMTLF